jgi:hypothetical protein
MKQKDNKQRLFEVMSKLDKTFKPKLNEEYISPTTLENKFDINEILNSYLETAIWAEESDENYLKGKTIQDVDKESKANSAIDIYQFLQKAQQEAAEELNTQDSESLGHNLWLSRNGHGAGFFDDNNDKLQNLARNMKEINIFMGADGKVYIE